MGDPANEIHELSSSPINIEKLINNDLAASSAKEGDIDGEPVGLMSTCTCYYVPISGFLDTSNGTNAVAEFRTQEGCSGGCARIIDDLYWSNNDCGFVPSTCIGEWNVYPPLIAIPFKCGIPSSSSFTVELLSGWFEGCGSNSSTESSLTFQIMCFDDCGFGSSPSYSKKATINFDPPIWFDANKATFALQGCGCSPTLML